MDISPQGGTLRANDIEAWALRIISRVESGTPIEDSRVELKRRWPDEANKVARRIAGHCNAAAGDKVLWLIGVDETDGVTGADPVDMGDWWAQVQSEFDELAPHVQELCIPSSKGVVFALLFETDRAPFVVRNASHGSPGGGPVAREVPWREGTSIRSAKRSDLLRLLIPTATLPVLQNYEASADARPSQGGHALDVYLTVYASVPLGTAIVLPDHQAHGRFRLPELKLEGTLETSLVAGSNPYYPSINRGDGRAHLVRQGDRQVILEGPGFFTFWGKFTLPSNISLISDAPCPLEVEFSVQPVNCELSATVERVLNVRTDQPRLSANTLGWSGATERS